MEIYSRDRYGAIVRGEVVPQDLRGEVVPKDLDITTERAGTTDRETAIRHVEQVMKLGYLSGDEAGKRVTYLRNATTKAQVREPLRDLPALVKKKKDLDDLTAIPLTALLVLLTAFISTAALGGVILEVAEPHPGIGVHLLTIPMLVVGVVGAITAIVTIAVKSDS